MVAKKTEQAIREYLLSLEDGARPIVDQEEVRRLRSEIKNEPDPIKRAKLMTALETEEEGRAPDISSQKDVFVAEAKAWAEAEGISPSALANLGVSDKTMRKAGFPRRSRQRNRSQSSPNRSPSVDLDDVVASAKKLDAPFKITDLATALNREPKTARGYVTRLVSDGRVKEVGDPANTGPGHARVYEVT